MLMADLKWTRFAAWLLAIDAVLYGLLYGVLGMFFPAFGDPQIAKLAGVSPAEFNADPLHGIWIREVVTVSFSRGVIALLVLVVAIFGLRSGRWIHIISLLFGVLLVRGTLAELEEGVTFIFIMGVALVVLWLVAFLSELIGDRAAHTSA